MKKLTLDDETEGHLRSGLSKGKRDDLSDADRAAIDRYRTNSPPVKSASQNSAERVLNSDAGLTGGETVSSTTCAPSEIVEGSQS